MLTDVELDGKKMTWVSKQDNGGPAKRPSSTIAEGELSCCQTNKQDLVPFIKLFMPK